MLTVSRSNIYLICPYIALAAVSHRRNEDIKFTFGADLRGLSFPHHPSYCWRLERQDAINQCLLFCSVERLWVTHLPNGLLWPGAYLTGIGPASEHWFPQLIASRAEAGVCVCVSVGVGLANNRSINNDERLSIDSRRSLAGFCRLVNKQERKTQSSRLRLVKILRDYGDDIDVMDPGDEPGLLVVAASCRLA